VQNEKHQKYLKSKIAVNGWKLIFREPQKGKYSEREKWVIFKEKVSTGK
jgi:hypothetical protein